MAGIWEAAEHLLNMSRLWLFFEGKCFGLTSGMQPLRHLLWCNAWEARRLPVVHATFDINGIKALFRQQSTGSSTAIT